jgi:hypothetical protein
MVPTCKSTIDCLANRITYRRQAAHVHGGDSNRSNSARGGVLLFEQFIGRLHLEAVGMGHGNEAAEERVDEQTVA